MDTPIIAQYYRETEPKNVNNFWIRPLHPERIRKQMKSAVKSMRHGTKIPQMMAALLTVI